MTYEVRRTVRGAACRTCFFLFLKQPVDELIRKVKGDYRNYVDDIIYRPLKDMEVNPMNDPANARWLRWLLSSIVFMLAVIAIELSVLIGPIVPKANAQAPGRRVLPDTAMQRLELLDAQQVTNAKLDQILQHLRTQVIKVKIVGTDKDKKAASKPELPSSKN